jgi:hypothetical protein
MKSEQIEGGWVSSDDENEYQLQKRPNKRKKSKTGDFTPPKKSKNGMFFTPTKKSKNGEFTPLKKSKNGEFTPPKKSKNGMFFTPTKKSKYKSSRTGIQPPSQKAKKGMMDSVLRAQNKYKDYVEKHKNMKNTHTHIIQFDLPNGVLDYLSKSVIKDKKERFVQLSNIFGTSNPVDVVKNLSAMGQATSLKASHLNCSLLTGHTHPSKDRKYNPPSSSDIHALLCSIQKESCGKKGKIILSHCVFLPDTFYVFTLHPALLTLPRSIAFGGLSVDNLVEDLADLDWLMGGSHVTAMYPILNIEQYKNIMNKFGIRVDEHKYPKSKNGSVTITIDVLATTNGITRTKEFK